ncbi:hypothetical protein DMC30DRAFT_267362 [Rhodotorula diobovata]|uniref:Uncharacterized protein n=1 Tax=Rhodotorula diobovata TaxID=5288 RepID=A0A5C5FTE7_9BASI|nr:hypothetical protein DMC30DRAFT_267362 [Rhodotorula diobovata]
MPLSIGGASSPIPPTASLLSQFAPSTVKPSSIFDDLPTDLRHDLPTVPELPDSAASSFSPSTFTASSAVPARPSYVTSPTALSEDGDSLPSPTFPSPAVLPRSTHASPDQIARPLPWASPDLSPRAASPATPPVAATATAAGALSPASPAPPLAPAVPQTPSGLTLLAPQAAVRRPSLVDAQSDSVATVVPAAQEEDQPAAAAVSPEDAAPAASAPPASEPPSEDGHAGAKPDESSSQPRDGDETKAGDESPEHEHEPEHDDDAAKAAADKAHKSKRRKRGARKEKRAARQAERATDTHGATSPVSPASPRSGSKLPTVSEGRDAVLEDLAAASQELARELSHTRSASSHRSTRSRPPVSSSRSHGTQSTSALPTTTSRPQDIFPSPPPPTTTKKAGGGMLFRLKTLVNEGNSDLEAFKRRVDERNASIGAKADTYSAPAQMQGAKAPRGKYDSPFSSRGSVGTTASIDSDRGRSSAQGDHWSSASTRRDRLADRRVKGGPSTAPNGGAASGGDFSPTSSSLTRGGGPSTLSGFDSTTSRTHTPLSSFSSVGSPASSNESAPGGTTSLSSTVRDWRRSPSPPGKRPYSASRSPPPPPGLAPPIGLAPAPESSPAPRPKLRDAATDTSDLGKAAASASGSRSPTIPSPAPTVVPLPPVAAARAPPAAAPAPAPRTRKDPPRAVVPPPPQPAAAQPASAPVTPVLSPASAPGISPASTPGATASSGKTNKLAKMLNSISVFNRTQPAAGAAGEGGAQ